MPEFRQPGANHEALRLRAELLQKIRQFMSDRHIMEVDTPILSQASVPDPNINSVLTSLSASGNAKVFYLHTSPEFCMKRLLASYPGAIFQITKVFRDDEIGRLHQPEFSLLEWYRPAFDHHDLMSELSDLLQVLGLPAPGRSSYEDVFIEYLDLNPHSAAISTLQSTASSLGLQGHFNDRSILLEFLFSHSITPHLGRNKPFFIYDYPICQAALARLSLAEPQTAERFELFVNGIELANGFHELTDAREQRQRFEHENQLRHERGMPEVPIDEPFLSALQSGIPDCSGVALGLERLLMVLGNRDHINDVMTFPMQDA